MNNQLNPYTNLLIKPCNMDSPLMPIAQIDLFAGADHE